MEYNGVKVFVSEGAFKEYKNEELKDIMEYLEDPDRYLEEKRKELNNDKIVGLDSEMIYKDYYDLQTRIDKAIEYIINHTQSTAHLEMDTKSIKQLLDILRGDE